MFAPILRGFVFLGVVFWYSTGVWKFVDEYFRNELKTYITKEIAKNENLKQDFTNNELIMVKEPTLTKYDERVEVESKQTDTNIQINPKDKYVPEYADLSDYTNTVDRQHCSSKYFNSEERCTFNIKTDEP